MIGRVAFESSDIYFFDIGNTDASQCGEPGTRSGQLKVNVNSISGNKKSLDSNATRLDLHFTKEMSYFRYYFVSGRQELLNVRSH